MSAISTLDVNPPLKNLQPCKVCTRTFLPQSLAKHETICERTAARRRKIFDSRRQRVGGTDLEIFNMRSFKSAMPAAKSPSPAKDEAPHKSHRPVDTPPAAADASDAACARSAVLESGDRCPLCDRTFAPKSFDRHYAACKRQHRRRPSKAQKEAARNYLDRPGYLRHGPLQPSDRCPFCDRTFGPKSYHRHVAYCKEQSARLPTKAQKDEAKTRLELRMNYRAPSIRRTVKEKYQAATRPAGVSDAAEENTPSSKDDRQGAPSIVGDQSNAKTKHDKPTNSRDATPIPTTDTYNPFLTAEKQLMELLECNDFKPYRQTKLSNTRQTPHKTKPKPKPLSPKSKAPILITSAPKLKKQGYPDQSSEAIDTRSVLEDDIDFEMLENFINDNFSDTTETIDPRLINDFDNLSIPEHLSSNVCSTPVMIQSVSQDIPANDASPKDSMTLPPHEIDDEVYEEYKRLEETFIIERTEQNQHRDDAHTNASFRRGGVADSAYARTPKIRSKIMLLSLLEPAYQKDAPCESTDGDATPTAFAKFCHECGKASPIPAAKFCIWCGAKRFAL